MRVLLITPGTRGDVAPAAGLGARLREAGHEVAIAANPPYQNVVEASGCTWRELPGDLAPLLAGEGRGSSFRQLTAYMDLAAEGARTAAAEGVDAILANAVAPFGHDIADRLGVPSAGAFLQPMHPSTAYPPVLLGLPRSLGPLGNRLAGLALAAAPAPHDKARRRIGRSRRKPHIFHGFSEAVVPRPHDWPARLSITGYWWPALPAGRPPPAGLLEFLDAGPPPVFLGFGSNGATDQALVIEAARLAGVRAVVQGSRPGAQVGGIFEVGEVPHEWLFPRMAAVVHHGGAGTTAAGLRAGVPTVAVPRYTDQPFWARRIHALGAGPTPVPHRLLTNPPRGSTSPAETLAAAIRAAVTEPRYRQNARVVAERLSTEDGFAPIITWLKQLRA